MQRRATSQPPPATKSVKFAGVSPASSGPSSPRQIKQRRERANSARDSHHEGGYDSEDSPRKTGHSRPEHNHTPSSDDDGPRRHRHHRRSAGEIPRDSSPAESDSTVDLPERFDSRGKRIAEPGEDPLAEKIQELFSGNGVGKMLQSFGLGGGGSEEEDGGRDRDRRRRRRRRRS